MISEDEEPVHALDLRIGKAAESITIFDEENVLASATAAGPDRSRKKHLSERYSPYPVASARHNSSEVLNDRNVASSSIRYEDVHSPNDDDRERWSKEREKEEWIRHLKQIQQVASKEKPLPPSFTNSWDQRLTSTPGAEARGFLHPRSDCCTPGCQGPPQSYPHSHNMHGRVAPLECNRSWPHTQLKEEPMSPRAHPRLDHRRQMDRGGIVPPTLAPMNHSDHFRNKFDSNYFLSPFQGHDIMKAQNLFQPPHHQQFLMAAAAQQHHQHQHQQHHHQQQQQQQQPHHSPYRMNTDELRRKILSMQSDLRGRQPNSANFPFNDPFMAQRQQHMTMNGPPPLLPFENVIKKEPNTGHIEEPSMSPNEKLDVVQTTFKEEQKEDDDYREKINPDKLRSTFLWHVLQRHSSVSVSSTATALPSHRNVPTASANTNVSATDETNFSEIDERLKTIEQASGLYNNQRRQQPDALPPSRVDNRFYHHEPVPVSSSHPSERHQMLAKLRDENLGFDYNDEKRKYFRDHLVSHSPAMSSVGEAVDATSPYRVTSPYAASLADPSGNGKRGRPRKHAPKIPLPPIYVFIRNLLYNRYYNPRVVSWVNDAYGIFRINNTNDFARTWGLMKTNRGVKMNYEKLSRAMRYHYGSVKQGRKGHLAMVKEKRLFYRFGELAVNWKSDEVVVKRCDRHDLCKQSLCLWTKE